MPRTSSGSWIRPVKRLAIYLRDECACVWCGHTALRVAPDGKPPALLTLDHLEPDGGHRIDNLVTSCDSCNFARKRTDVFGWLAGLDARLEEGATARAAQRVARARGTDPPFSHARQLERAPPPWLVYMRNRIRMSFGEQVHLPPLEELVPF